MKARSRPRIVLLGMLTKMPVAGVVWQVAHYLVGLERLGCQTYYVEAHGRTPTMFMQSKDDDATGKAVAFLDTTMRRFGFEGRWAFHARHADGRCYGMSGAELSELYATADLILNLHGGTVPTDEMRRNGRLVLIDTDPVDLQINVEQGDAETVEFLAMHRALFSFGENYGRPDCMLPVSPRFHFLPTRQPVVMDFWDAFASDAPDDAAAYTTIANWRQQWREITYRGTVYTWSKHHEFMKFLDLPRHVHGPFELALASYEPTDRLMLEAWGWRVTPALAFSHDPDRYRDYIARSRGEFTVAKDQNIRLRSGWFSDRSATYLAAGRPVITQETGFSNVLPTGEGLFGFSTREDVATAVEAIVADPRRHRCAALEVARECFSYDKVLPPLLAVADA